MKSIMQNKKVCFICQREEGVEEHHIFFGSKNRKQSELHGLKVWLCYDHHRGKTSPHLNINVDRHLKQIAQKEFERTHTRAEFMAGFGRNYLDVQP